MKNILRILLAFLGLIIITQGTYAEKLITERDLKTKELKAGAAGCSAGAGFAFLEVNNIRARINTGGDMWWNFDRAQYFVPANSQKTSMFSASLWIGGLDVNGQLKLAAQRYRASGDDYWPGPLSIDGSASVDDETCSQYDKLFKITRADVDEYLNWWNSTNPNEEFPGYSIPLSILDWPAHGDVSKNQSYYLAPFYDENGDGDYDPNQGDYPYYDVDNSLCTTLTPTMDAEYYHPDDPDNWKYGILADQVIKGDQTLWWVFNDKGNVHSETTGAPIGMEIRGQSFGFSTNDEINNMTFYSYEIINRSTFTLTETYFSQWVDTDLGYAWDDYVGCDVARGLGYCYNGVDIDGTGEVEAYGVQPPAIGVDFFQGPYMDPDGLDNPKYQFVIDPVTGDTIEKIQICDVSINGINFGDGIIDNERFGMRRFVYHDNCGGGPTCDPSIAPEYYNFLRGIWKDNTKMQYGGNAHFPDADGPETDFMFPSDTDPCNWATGGQPPNAGWNQNGKYWDEETANNNPSDRRFMQSAGPFDLYPGAVNYITVGIPWARASSGGAWASVQLLRIVDDKCQALFDNCFKVLDGPDAPDLSFLEMDRKMIVYIANRKGANNYRESYKEIDPNIQISDTIPQPERDSLRTYTFEGYQIFQLRTSEVSPESLHDPDYARLVAQFDKKNGITKLVNYYYDQNIEGNVPVIEVVGGDQGISHSFEITEDAFADKDTKIVNHKQYYYMVLAYAFNEYQPYSQEPGVTNGLYGQKQPYLAGRKNIKVYTAIPHKNVNGITLNSTYGDGFEITRLQGHGNGGFELEMTQESLNEVMTKAPASADNQYGDDNYPIVYNPTYKVGYGPLNVKVVDPLNVQDGNYTLRFTNVSTPNSDSLKINNAKWVLTDEAGNSYPSDTTINVRNEQLIPELGISVTIDKIGYPGDSISVNNGFINSSIHYTDSTQMWFSGVPDVDVPASPLNWIRSGVYKDDQNTRYNDYDMSADNPWDALQVYEKLIGGTWAPYGLTAANDQINIGPAINKISKSSSGLKELASIDVVITSDKSLWTRCPVIEMCPDPLLAQGGALQYRVRKSPSIDKDGDFAAPNALPSDDANDPAYISGSGMGWFPGYVINIETGERLNVMYSENSWLAGENGRDMQWNPTSNFISNQGIAFGGMHYLYVMKHIDLPYGQTLYHFPAYDAGKTIRDTLTGTLPAILNLTAIYASTMYVNMPMAVSDSVWLPAGNDVTIKLRVSKPYERYFSTALDSLSDKNQNNFDPMYSFTTAGYEAVAYSAQKNSSDLDLINVVPNPYYAYADGPGYERNQLDNRVKITNLPEKCVVTIYSVNGTLVRQYSVDKEGITNPRGSTNGVDTDMMTSIDWDLKNFAGIPIAGGLYLIHVKETGGRSGERVVKWFGALRPIDVNTF
jgi:hypothetical protein